MTETHQQEQKYTLQRFEGIFDDDPVEVLTGLTRQGVEDQTAEWIAQYGTANVVFDEERA